MDSAGLINLCAKDDGEEGAIKVVRDVQDTPPESVAGGKKYAEVKAGQIMQVDGSEGRSPSHYTSILCHFASPYEIVKGSWND